MTISRPRFVLLYTLVCLIWGSTWLVIRLGGDAELPPFLGATLRFSIALIFLWGWVVIRKLPLPQNRTEWRASIVNGLLGIGTSYSIVYWSSQYVPSGLEAVIFGTMPLWTILLSHYTLPDERLTTSRVLGILLGLAGIGLIFLPDVGHISINTLIAMVLMLLAPLASAGALVITKPHMKQLNPITLNTVSISAGLIVILIEAAIFTDFSNVHFTFTHAWTSAYLGTLGTVVTFVVYYRLLQQTRALTMAYIALITPVVAVTLGWLIAHERFDGYTIFGSLLVLLGVWVALRTPSGLVTAGDREVIETFAEEQELYP